MTPELTAAFDRVREDLRQEIRASAAETRAYIEQKVEASGAETRAYVDQKVEASGAETRAYVDQKVGASGAETQAYVDASASETRRQLGVLIEDLRSTIQVVAEGVVGLNQKFDALTGDHDRLHRRVDLVEDRVAALEQSGRPRRKR